MDDRYGEQEGEEWPPEEPGEAMFASASDLEELNTALLPAALCATSYAKSCWAFDVAAGVADPVAWMGEADFARDPWALARSLMIAKVCEPMSAPRLGIDPSASGASFERGVWRKGDLASALCCLAEREDGSRELHLCVRGTEPENNPAPWISSFQTLVGYFAWTYPRIEKHAKSFEPLADAIRDYAADPANGVDRIVVSGHSLGAAAAESLLPRLRASGVGLEMVGFGSPGTGSGWAAPLFAAVRGAVSASAGAARAGLAVAAGSLSWAGRLTEGARSKPLSAFSEMARRAGLALRPGPARRGDAQRVKVTQFRHPNDPVPKLGSLLYSTSGVSREAIWPSEFSRRLAGGGLGVSGFGAHSMTRYASAVEFMLERAWEEIRPGAPAPERLAQITRAKVESARLEAGIPVEIHNEAVRAAREKNIGALRAINPADPAIAWARALPEPVELADKIRGKRAVRKILAALSAKDRLGEPADFRGLNPKPPAA